MKILIADDELPIREWLKMSMENLDGEKRQVMTAGNGKEAWDIFEREAPELVITDIRMPKMSGLELLKKIKNQSPDTYVVMLTSYDEFEYARQAIKSKANEYVLKNEISGDVLRQIIFNYQAASNDKKASLPRYLKDLLADGGEFPIEKKEGERFFAAAFQEDAEENLTGSNKENTSEKAFDTYMNTFVRQIEHFCYEDKISVWICSCKMDRSDGACFGEAMSFCQNLSALKETDVGFSGFINDPKQACIYARSALNIGFYEKRTGIFTYQEVSENEIQEIRNIRKKTISMINKERQEEAKEYIWELYKKAGELRVSNLDLLRECFLDIVDAYKVSKLEFAGSELEELCIRVKAQIRDVESFFVLGELTETFLAELSGTILIGEKAYSGYVKSAMAYVVNNYPHIESLTEVADYVNINADYFCRVFKQETGVTFNGYLTSYRIQKAVELLTKTDLKVYEVAEKVGYSNLSYFSRVFKKVTGENPFSFKN